MIYLPPHKASLTISHNEHKTNYETAAEYIERESGRLTFRSKEDYETIAVGDEVWEMQWYPETPVGFYAIAAPTLEALIEYAKELHHDTAEKL